MESHRPNTRRKERRQGALLLDYYFFLPPVPGSDSPFWLAILEGLAGTRMFVPQFRHRTVLPRAVPGTDSTRRHVKFGHIMRMFSELMEIP